MKHAPGAFGADFALCGVSLDDDPEVLDSDGQRPRLCEYRDAVECEQCRAVLNHCSQAFRVFGGGCLETCEMTPCPIPACPNPAPDGKPMCPTCWSRVNRNLQRQVTLTWRHYTMCKTVAGRRMRLAAWRVARDRAVAAVSKKENA